MGSLTTRSRISRLNNNLGRLIVELKQQSESEETKQRELIASYISLIRAELNDVHVADDELKSQLENLGSIAAAIEEVIGSVAIVALSDYLLQLIDCRNTLLACELIGDVEDAKTPPEQLCIDIDDLTAQILRMCDQARTLQFIARTSDNVQLVGMHIRHLCNCIFDESFRKTVSRLEGYFITNERPRSWQGVSGSSYHEILIKFLRQIIYAACKRAGTYPEIIEYLIANTEQEPDWREAIGYLVSELPLISDDGNLPSADLERLINDVECESKIARHKIQESGETVPPRKNGRSLGANPQGGRRKAELLLDVLTSSQIKGACSGEFGSASTNLY